MDELLKVLTEILFIVRDNFWQIFLIIALLRHKEFSKYTGIFALLTYAMFGGIRWFAWLILFVISVIIESFVTAITKRSEYELEIKKLKDQIKDPDYR